MYIPDIDTGISCQVQISNQTRYASKRSPYEKKLYGTYMSKLYVKYRGHIIVKYMSLICILNVNEVEDI